MRVYVVRKWPLQGRSRFVCWNITRVSLWLLCKVHFVQSTQRTGLQRRPFVRGINNFRVKKQRNILHEIRKRKANLIGHILHRNCLLQRVTEGKIQGGIEVTVRQGRRRRKLLDDLKERRGYSHLKEEALDHTMWRARFGRVFGPVVRHTTK
jgi:hypothetical protein